LPAVPAIVGGLLLTGCGTRHAKLSGVGYGSIT
jgi:hypothetical protein